MNPETVELSISREQIIEALNQVSIKPKVTTACKAKEEAVLQMNRIFRPMIKPFIETEIRDQLKLKDSPLSTMISETAINSLNTKNNLPKKGQ